MFTDEQRRNAWDQIRQRDLRQFARLLPPAMLKQAAGEAGVGLGRGVLNLAALLWLSLACALRPLHNFSGVLGLTLKLLRDAQDWSPQNQKTNKKVSRGRGRSRHDPHGQGKDATALSEEAFVQARRKAPMGFWIALILLLGRAFEQKHGALLHYWKGFRLLALDGTTIGLPARKALIEHFGVASNQHGSRRTVQARMVMLQFPLTRLPWRYELTPLCQGERTVAARLLGQLQPGDLVLMDKGFFSYRLFWQVQQSHAFFATRLMAGVKLRTIRRLGDNDRLVSWTPSDRQWARAGLPACTQLRVIDYQVPGFRPSAIVTNVLSPNRISRQQWIGLSGQPEAARRIAPGLYHRRWEIETTFCELKVHQRMEASLRGRSPQTIAYEIAGHVLLYLLVRWLMVEAAKQQGLLLSPSDADVTRLSFTNALREIMDLSPALVLADARRVQTVLLPLLLRRIASHVVPLRPGRHYPRPGDMKVRYKGSGKYALPSKLVVHKA